MFPRVLILSATLLAGAGFVIRADRIEPVAARQSFSSFPMRIGSWEGRRAADFDPKVLTLLGADEYLNGTYANGEGVPIGLYIGYYESQRQGDAVHSPLNCLPGAGWQPVSKGTLTMQVRGTAAARQPDRSITVNRYIVQKGERRTVVLYWYQSHGRVVASEYWSKIHMVVDAIRTNRTDASLVRVIAPAVDMSPGAESDAERRAVAFIHDMFPLLSHYLPS